MTLKRTNTTLVTILFLILAVMASMVVMSNPPQVISVHRSYTPRARVLPFSYEDLRFTDHALNAHKGQAWNAVRIANFFKSGQCKPESNNCPGKRTVHWCEIDELEIAIVVIERIRLVITGYAARKGYWSDRCGATA